MITDVKTIFSLDYRSLALFRVILGLYLVLDTKLRFYFIPYLYSDQSIIPRELVELRQFSEMYHFQLLFLSGSEWYAYLFFTVLLICGILLLIGFKTRLMTFFCWLLYTSVILRDPLTTHAADILLIIMLFWGFFLPLGKKFSVDNLLTKNNSTERKLTFSASTVALYIQVSLLYIMTGIFKASAESWKDGSFIYLTLSRFDYVEPFGMLVYPYYELLTFLTHFTLILELFGPLLLFIPIFFVQFRLLAIVLFTGLQVSIGLMIDVGLFPLISCGALFAFLPRQFWDRIESFVPENWKTSFKDISENLKTRASELRFLKIKKQPERDISSRPIVNVIVTLLIIYVLIWNISQVTNLLYKIDPPRQIGYFLKLDQRWNMFIMPADRAEHLAVEVTFDDGKQKDLIDDLKADHGEFKGIQHVGYKNYRWRIFFSNNLRHDTNSEFQEKLIQYMVSNKLDKNKINSIQSVELAGYYHIIGSKYSHKPVQRRSINKLELVEHNN